MIAYDAWILSVELSMHSVCSALPSWRYIRLPAASDNTVTMNVAFLFLMETVHLCTEVVP